MLPGKQDRLRHSDIIVLVRTAASLIGSHYPNLMRLIGSQDLRCLDGIAEGRLG